MTESSWGGDDLRMRRMARNEMLARHVNERIERAGNAQPHERLGLICECSDADCRTVVNLTEEQYRNVRRHPERFIVVLGHETAVVERVVERHGGWAITEKVGLAREVAQQNARHNDT
ncbi:MAG: hypothetical protein M3P18_05490 [Actinomycetota bacterium]|nr:hypothetical protein [Actinomycetota bacterium]